MAFPLPCFSNGEMPFAERPAARCYACKGPVVHERGAHADRRACASLVVDHAGEHHCQNVPSETAAVVLDLVAEWTGAPEFVDRVPVPEPFFDAVALDRRDERGMFIVNVPQCYLLRPPSPSQRLALALMHCPEIQTLLADVRAEHGIEPEEALRSDWMRLSPWDIQPSAESRYVMPSVISGIHRLAELLDGAPLTQPLNEVGNGGLFTDSSGADFNATSHERETEVRPGNWIDELLPSRAEREAYDQGWRTARDRRHRPTS